VFHDNDYDLTEIEACALPGRLLFSAPSAALAPPSDEPSDHEHGPHESDDHAYADEQIGENDSVPPSMVMPLSVAAGGLLGSPPPDA
jgi:hypothetical protein